MVLCGLDPEIKVLSVEGNEEGKGMQEWTFLEFLFGARHLN